jgi:hypothetical protein
MDQEREDYEERDAPPLSIDSPAALLLVFAKAVGVAALSVSAVLALLLLGAILFRQLLR